MTYRPDIDGLRAIAVLSVVLYHFGVPGLGGGFVGVDVFFVISGFLIGGLLWKELKSTGRLDLPAFYMRRIRRLAPAFFAMAAASSVAAWFILLPFEFREFGKSLIAATVWLSNVQFWREAGYFDIGADTKVLLHTWSLSVEEQFYIFLPLAFLVLRFVRLAMIPLLVLIWAASLAVCIYVTPSDPIATFFLFPFRAWEMLTGVLLAIAMQRRAFALPALFSWIGLALVIASILFVRSAGFPGWQALGPVMGTAMMLAAGGSDNPVNRVLSMRGPVFVGLISYSLYLWHWPVLVLSTYWRNGYENALEAAGWLALAVVLAIVSWALVERPLRRATWIPQRGFGVGALAVALLAIGFGGFAFVRDGVPARFGSDVRGHIAASADFLQDWSRCDVPLEGDFAGVELCAIGPEGDPQVVIWGDSHLRALMDGLAASAEETQTPGLIIWHAGCPGVFGLNKIESAATPAQDADCRADTETLRTALPTLESAEKIMLVGRWAYYVNGTGIGDDINNTIAISALPGSGLQGDTSAELFGNALVATVGELSQTFETIYLMRQVPEIPNYSSREIARGLAHGWMTQEEANRRSVADPDVLASRVSTVETSIYPMVQSAEVMLMDPWPILCPERCSVLYDGAPVYFDNNHLTNAGAMALRPMFAPLFETAPNE